MAEKKTDRVRSTKQAERLASVVTDTAHMLQSADPSSNIELITERSTNLRYNRALYNLVMVVKGTRTHLVEDALVEEVEYFLRGMQAVASFAAVPSTASTEAVAA